MPSRLRPASLWCGRRAAYGRLVEQAVQVEGARDGRQLLVHVHHARRVRSMLIERSKSARARPVTAGAVMAQTTSEHAIAAAVRGMPVVQSTGEIELQGPSDSSLWHGGRPRPPCPRAQALSRSPGGRLRADRTLQRGTRISPASCCSTAGAARQRARRRICAASKNRLAWRTSASGRDKMMTMMMTEHVPGQR